MTDTQVQFLHDTIGTIEQDIDVYTKERDALNEKLKDITAKRRTCLNLVRTIRSSLLHDNSYTVVYSPQNKLLFAYLDAEEFIADHFATEHEKYLQHIYS